MAVNVKLLRTDAANKRPTAAQMDVGELALNYDQSTPGLFFEDDNGGVRKIGPVEVGSSAPNSSPVGQTGNSVGEMWLDSSATPNVLKVYDGSTWRAANLVEGVSTSATSTVLTLSNSAITLSQTLGFDSASDITFIDDSATALEFKQGSDTYLTFDSTNADEKVIVSKALVQTPGSSVTPANNGDLVVEATSNTTLTFKLKGSDGTVRSGTLTLS